MLNSKFFIVILLGILLGITYYNQALPPLLTEKINTPIEPVTIKPGDAKAPKSKDAPIRKSDFNSANPQFFEDILKKPKDAADSTDTTTAEANARSENQIASNVVVGERNDQLILDSSLSGDPNRRGSQELDALREAAELFNNRGNSSLIPGFRASNGSSSPDVVAPPAVAATATRTSDNNNVLKDVTGQARGYTMLYLMHPKAKQTVEKQVDAMLRSKVQQLYLGVLTDGTFGKDFNYLSSIIRKIAREKRSLVLTVYLTNGPSMRSGDDVEAPFTDIDPADFRTLIRTDQAVQNRFIELVKPVVAVLQLNKRLNSSNKNYVSVMLEDNLDDESYLAMRSLAFPLLGTRATFIRNPCEGCLEGNTTDGLGDPIEAHTLDQLATLGLDDAFSFDGLGYRLPGETEERIPSFEEAKSAAVTALSRGIRYFGLWRFERQGNKLGVTPLLPVDERTYEVPDEAAIQAEIEILRAGLTEVQ